MKKLAVFLLTLSLFALFVTTVHAQEDTERWVCMQAETCGKEPNSCSAKWKGNGHTARLSAKTGFEPLVGTPTYVVVCIATDNGQICTTGNESADQKVYGKSNITEMNAAPLSFKFNGLFKADGTTVVANPSEWAGPYEWGDEMPSGHMHTWFALNYWNPTVAATGGEGGQQQGTFDFETAEKDCIKIGWDPYGRVFDAGTLEPIYGASVTLQVKKEGVFRNMTTSDLMGGNLINPQTTLEDGNFSFVVPDGEYKLITVPEALTATTTLDANYAKAYSDIYPAMTGEVIVQQGAIQHRDIPVATKGTNTAPKLMEYFYQTTSDGLIILEGRTSHPLTKLNVKTSKITAAAPDTKVPYRTVEGEFSADKLGKFRIEINQNKFEQTPDYTEVFSDLELVKVDLRQPTTRNNMIDSVLSWLMNLVKPVEAQGKITSIKFEPIPQYLEGYAYDATGKVLPNATVGVYLSFSKKPYSTTKTDANGFFKLTSEYLPNFAYSLQYTTAAGVKVATKPSAFLAQNQKYLATNKVNLFVGKDLKNNIAPTAAKAQSTPPAKMKDGTNSGISGGVDAVNKAQEDKQKQMAAQTLPLILIIVLLVVVAVVGVVIYLKKKQQVTLPPPTL